MRPPLTSHIRTALEVPWWAVRFYLRYFPLVFGISLIPAAERFAGQLWDTPAATMEMATASARLVLVIVVVLLAIARDPDVSRAFRSGVGSRARQFYRTHWPSLLVQFFLISAAWALFDLVPEQVVTQWIPESALSLYLGTLLAVKNVTVVAVTFIWMVGLVRQPLLWAATHGDQPAGAASSSTRGADWP